MVLTESAKNIVPMMPDFSIKALMAWKSDSPLSLRREATYATASLRCLGEGGRFISSFVNSNSLLFLPQIPPGFAGFSSNGFHLDPLGEADRKIIN